MSVAEDFAAYRKVMAEHVDKLNQQMDKDYQEHLELERIATRLDIENAKLKDRNDHLTFENIELRSNRPASEADAADLAAQNTRLRTELAALKKERMEAYQKWRTQNLTTKPE